MSTVVKKRKKKKGGGGKKEKPIHRNSRVTKNPLFSITRDNVGVTAQWPGLSQTNRLRMETGREKTNADRKDDKHRMRDIF